jgi:DNA-binding response OmpR family regulator
MSATILIVDDEINVLNTLETQLREAGYTVFSATNGNEGLKKCKFYKPDAVILDIFMPGMQGNRVAEAISEDPQTARIPIIFVTSLLTKKEVPQDNLLGGRYFIAKPFKFEELHALLKHILRNKYPAETE